MQLFGSKDDDNAKGGNVDLLVVTGQVVQPLVQLTAKLAVKIM